MILAVRTETKKYHLNFAKNMIPYKPYVVQIRSWDFKDSFWQNVYTTCIILRLALRNAYQMQVFLSPWLWTSWPIVQITRADISDPW